MSDYILDRARNLSIRHNVSINILDADTLEVVHHHEGHNAATNTLLSGIGRYLSGEAVFNQVGQTLIDYIPSFLSVGTMGLTSQEEDENGLPKDLGPKDNLGGTPEEIDQRRCDGYLQQAPSFYADGYSSTADGVYRAEDNNYRSAIGLGRMYKDRPDPTTCTECELISDSFPRVPISYRSVIPEKESEFPRTIDVVFSGIISMGALKQFREPGKDYIFITEAGLWSTAKYSDSGGSGLLAGYRIAPSGTLNTGLASDREKIKREIIKVGKNQVVQIIWKIQLGAIGDLGELPDFLNQVKWVEWPEQIEPGEDVWAEQPLQPWPGWQGINDTAKHNFGMKWRSFI